MTGYGRGRAEASGHRVAAEIRSVNHRFLDLKMRGAQIDPGVEEKVAARVRSRVARGSVSVTLRVEAQSDEGGVQVNVAAARRAHHSLRSLHQSLGLEGDVDFALITQQPGVLSSASKEADEVLIDTAVRAADEALDRLLVMRETEGERLGQDLEARVANLRGISKQLQEACKSSSDDAQTRLRERLDKLLARVDVSVDEQRLAQEVAVLADRTDVTEEIVRVASHLSQVDKALASDKPVGRRLDFLVQELAREFNTVASKSQATSIAALVVDAKVEIEKIREQVQNIE